MIASPEDGAVVTLPAVAPKGPNQVEKRGDEETVSSVLDHLGKAEDGSLGSGGGGAGAFTRSAFVYRAFDGRLFPSTFYRYEHFLDALRTMATEGVDGKLFFLGHGQGGEDGSTAVRRRLQDEEEEGGARGTVMSETSLVYGLVNVAAFLSHAMTDSIIHDACDELNVDYLGDDDADGVGLDDGRDAYRFPVSNACGQHDRSYEDEMCEVEDAMYDCFAQMSNDEMNSMEAQAISRGQWGGAPGPFYCGPKDAYGATGKPRWL